MKSVAFMWRLTLRKILIVLMGAIVFLFGGCPPWSKVTPDYGVKEPEYGAPYPPPLEIITGTVIGNEKPVPGFWVSLLNEHDCRYTGYQHYTFTEKNGAFNLYICDPNQFEGDYTLFFQDVDGPLNGEFNSKTIQWRSGDGPLHIVLEAKE